jgi:hypothetical protein
MSASRFLNDPHVRCIVQVHSPGGWHKIVFDMDQMEEFKADPDLFAARYFRLSREDYYLEWIDLDGNALCGERDKSGQPCGYRVAGSRSQLNPKTRRDEAGRQGTRMR